VALRAQSAEKKHRLVLCDDTINYARSRMVNKKFMHPTKLTRTKAAGALSSLSIPDVPPCKKIRFLKPGSSIGDCV
jgi:hypothetical protein